MDLADQIDDYICTFEGIGDLTADMLAMFIFIWAVLALFLIWLCKFLYNKYVTKNLNNKNEHTTTTITTTVTSNSAGLINNSEKRRLSEPREIVASKDVKDLSSKSFGIGGGLRSSSRGRLSSGGSGGGGGGYVPPTPPIRKRLTTRMSPGPELRSSKSRSIIPPSNVVGPETTSVTWTSQIFRWLYSDLVIVNELLSRWIQSLNNSTSKAAEDHGVAVEIVRLLPDSPAPSLQNIFCQSEEHDPSEMVISCDCDAMPVLQIRAVRQKSGKMETHHYKTTISRFRARLSAPMNYNSLKGEMKIEGYPDIRIVLNSVGAVKPMDQDEQHLQDIIIEILTNALRDTIYPIDFSIYSTCPRAPEIQQENFLQPNFDHYNLQNQSSFGVGPLATKSVSTGRRLLVKILKGEGLIKAKDPYCVIEMDEPPQKNQTGARQGTDPYWDEHFLFDLSPQSAEILFEVYDRPDNPTDSPKFLGLGLVGIDELAVGPASSQILTLQPRPYETETVNGAILVEFVFIDGAEVPAGPRPYKLKEALKISTPMINEHLKNGANLADAAVKALQEGALGGTANGQPSKSTLIIHSVQRNNRTPFKVELNKDGQIEMNENIIDEVDNDGQQKNLYKNNNDNNNETILNDDGIETKKGIDKIKDDDDVTNQTGNHNAVVSINGNVENESFGRSNEPQSSSSPYSIQSNGTGTTDSLLNRHNRHTAAGTGSDTDRLRQQQNSSNENNHNLTTSMDDDRSRSRKKRDFFGTIKRRFGKSKTRSKSFDRAGMIPIETGNLNGSARSISVDRDNSRGGLGGGVGGEASGAGTAKGESGTFSNNTSPGRKLILPTLDQSRRSSLSESSAISGFSSASAKTYLHEASTLVLETIENGIKRHFLVPLAIAQRPRWRRKGTKLHIYNDHTFVAKHLSGGGLICAVCTKSIPRRPGKQGYECRDCQLICHKQCHIRVPQACSNPTVLSMELSALPILTEAQV